MSRIRIAHIINPVKVTSGSDLFTAQPVTFKTMLKARNASKYMGSIKQYVIGYEEDREIFPAGFEVLKALEKSVMDFGVFSRHRRLPLIADILNSLNDIDADYIIYTNVDIAVMPFFYDYVLDKLQDGSDSLIINRRVVASLKSDAVMYAEIGESHPGYDCFVFRKELLLKFILGNTCIGANWIGRAMYANLLTFSKKLEIIKDAHLTFHIGEDGAWLTNDFSEYDIHNKKEVYGVLNALFELDIEENKQQELQRVLNFMDSWEVKKPEIIKKRSMTKRIKSRIKKIVYAFYK